MEKLRSLYPYIIITVILFFAYLPFSLKVTFMQNDDWYYHLAVQEFKKGNFILNPDIAPTFYAQGFFGVIFTLFLPEKLLPLLTLAASVLCFYLMSIIVAKVFKKDLFVSISAGLLLFFNPIFQYSIWGFMTENYFVLFLLLSLLYIYKYTESSRFYDLFLTNIFIIVGFLIRQVSLITSFAFCFMLLCKKNYKGFLLQLFITISLCGAYIFSFPKTQEMTSKGFQFHHFSDIPYVYALLYGTVIYIFAFLFPSIFDFLLVQLLRYKLKVVIICLLLAPLLFGLLTKPFNPQKVSWGEFPYFENVFERSGFIPREIHGTKYQFKGNFDIYRYWGLASNIAVSIVLASMGYILFKKLKFSNASFYVGYIFLYILVLILLPTFYDRYILVLVPIVLLMLCELKLPSTTGVYTVLINLPRIFFLAFLIFFSVNLSWDFVAVRNYIWSRSTDLVGEGVEARNIYANSAWNEMNGSKFENAFYLFSFDSFEVNPELEKEYIYVEAFEPSNKFKFFINPRVYMYKRNNLITSIPKGL